MTLSEAEYQHILAVVRSLALVIERNPSSFATLDQESIRDHIFLQLDGHYEGAATGETFNSNGKTDILICVDDRNISSRSANSGTERRNSRRQSTSSSAT